MAIKRKKQTASKIKEVSQGLKKLVRLMLNNLKLCLV